MEWFEQVKDTVVKTAGVAYEKSEQLVDIAKLKLSIVTNENETEKLFKELGKQYFRLDNGEDTKALCDEIIANIKTKLSEKEELQNKINSVKKVKTCPSCKKQAATENTFCPHCGAKLSEEEEIIISE